MAKEQEDLEQLLQKVEAVPEGTPELDREFAEVFSKHPATFPPRLTLSRD